MTGALSAVGLGTVPAWLRPYPVLSNGEKFRADLARVICDAPERVVIDEFTSVVDRKIARIGALAFQKAWRRTGGQAMLLSCHYDIIEWLEPDWVFDTATGKYSGRGLWRRPRIGIELWETDWRYWPLFEPHHYLKLPHMIAATNYVATVDGELVAHVAVSTRSRYEARACRLVVMPEWQGAGVGMRFLNAVCDRWRRGLNRYERPMPVLFHTSHPGLCEAIRRDPKWCQVSAKLYGDNKARSAASINRSREKAGRGRWCRLRVRRAFQGGAGIPLHGGMKGWVECQMKRRFVPNGAPGYILLLVEPHPLGSQPMLERVHGRLGLALLGLRPGGFFGIPAIGFDLLL